MVAGPKCGINLKIVGVEAQDPLHMGHIRALFEAYAESLDFDLDFQDFQTEIHQLPGDYAAPEGCLLLALDDREAAGCVALRKWSRDICEMKRLFVRNKFRGRGVGRRLAATLIERARQMGYRRMRLDTVPAMTTAKTLYRSLGFKEIGAYRYNPIDGATFLELEFDNHRDRRVTQIDERKRHDP